MKRGWLLGALCLGTSMSFSAFERMPYGVDLAGLAGAGTARPMVWGVFGNPAGAAGIRVRTLSLLHSPEPFGLRELERSALVFAEPAFTGCFVVGLSRFGFDLYREVTASISYAHRFSDQLDAGIAVTYYRLSIGSYGAASTVGVDMGVQWTMCPGLRGGFTATNVNAPTIGATGEKLPQLLSGGIAYEPLEGISVVLDVFKDLHFPLETRFGVEYRLVDELTLRAGVARDPAFFCAGLGFSVRPVIIDYAFQHHIELGFVHHIGVTIALSGW